MPDTKPKFDPNKKFESADEKPAVKPAFDPTKSFEPEGDLKKKDQSNLISPSASGGSTSESGNGASVLPKIDFEGARTYKVPAKTALGNKVIKYTQPSPTISLQEEASNKKLAYDYETKKLVDNFDNYKASVPDGKNLDVAQFYIQNLKTTNPDEYKYVIEKQKALTEEGDPLKIQEHTADLVKKSLALKSRVLGGKLDIVSNNINDNYKPILEDFYKTSKEAEALVTKITGIDNYINENFQTDQNGQIVTTPTNRKSVEDLLNKRSEFINQLSQSKQKLDDYSKNQDLTDAVSQLDELQKNYDSAESLYKDFVNNNPDAYKGLPDVKKQIEKEQKAQFLKDLNEEFTGGDLGIMEGAGRGATGIVKALTYGIKNLGSDKEYGFTDKLYDDVKGSLDKFDAEYNPLPTGYDKPVYEDGKWNLQYLPGKLSQTIVEMAPMYVATAGIGATAGLIARGAASGDLAYALGSFAGEHMTTVSDYYDEARDAGMSEDDAQDFANKTATFQAMIGMLSPDIKLLKGNKIGIEEYTKLLAKGVSKKDAAKEAAKTVVNNMLKEIPQENLQTWKEIQDKNAMYEEMGLNDKVKKSITNDMVETTVVSAIISAGFGLGGTKSASSLQKQAAFMAASEPELILQKGQKLLEKGVITPDQFNDLSIKVVKANEALGKIDKNLSAEKKSEVLPAMIEKDELKAEKQSVDDSQHDIINEKIKNKDEEIKNILDSPSKEQIDHDNFLKGFDDVLSSENKKPKDVNIPKSENEMQLEGLIELDDSEKSKPIDFPVEPETKKSESDSNEDKIALLEKARKDLKVNEFFQEKIDYKEYSRRDAALEKEINSLKKPILNEENKVEGEQEKIGEPDTSNNETSDEAKPTESIDGTEDQKGPATEKIKQKDVNNESLIDEEDEADSKIKDDQDVLRKMQDDLNVLKQFSITNSKQSNKTPDEIKSLAVKKYQGMIERAYKAKLDGKINRSTYTIFRNAAGDILGPKIAEKNREVKGQIDAIKDKIKEKLLGEGYKSSQLYALSSIVPITPKTVENFIDLTAELVKRGVDAGHEVRKVVDKALEYVKSHKNYEPALKEAGVSDEKFRKMFESKIGEIQSIVDDKSTNTAKNKETKLTDEKSDDTKSVDKKSDKSDDEQNNEPEPKRSSIRVMSSSEYETGDVQKRKGTERLEANKKYESVLSSMKNEDKSYRVMSLKSLEKAVREKISEVEKAGMLSDLAKDLLDKNSSSKFPDVAMPELLSQLGDKFNSLAESETNEFIKKDLYKTAAELFADKGKIMTNAAQTMNAGRLAAERMPTSEVGIRSFVKEKIDQVQNEAMSEINKKDIEKANQELVDLQVKKELEKIAEGTMSKERISKIKGISSLKIDLSEC